MKREKHNEYQNMNTAVSGAPIASAANEVISDELPTFGGHQDGVQSAPGPTRDAGTLREYITEQIELLGNPHHPHHRTAADALAAIGTPAIPFLRECLVPQKPWFLAYRAIEVLSRIRDGEASKAILPALRHPNSNVRWAAVRALAQVGDFRALLELRRVAQEDHGRTSWGESVSGAAQSALDQIQSQSSWRQGVELIKTACTSILMILSLILAFSVVNALQGEISSVAQTTPVHLVPGPYVFPTTSAWGHSFALGTTGNPIREEEHYGQQVTTSPTVPITPSPTMTPEAILGRAISAANVRPQPSVLNPPIGVIHQGDEIVFLSMSPDGMWYRIRLGRTHADHSRIDNADGSKSGWVHRELVSPPKERLPVEELPQPKTR